MNTATSQSTISAQEIEVIEGTSLQLCPVCAASDNRFWGVKTDHTMFQCKRCGVVFFDRKLFKTHEYGNYYDYTDDWDPERVSWEVTIRTRAFKSQLRQLASYVEGRRLVDVGAGPGYLCHIAASEGWQAQGVELSEKALLVGRQFLNVEYVQLDDIPDESVDVMTCYHILEHMEEPNVFLSKVHSKLKSNGIVAVHVPHQEPLSFAIRNLLIKRRIAEVEKHCQLYIPEHISGFTCRSLINTFNLFGFEPLMVRTCAMWSSYYDPFFLKEFSTRGDYLPMLKRGVRSLIDNVGVIFGKGDWVVGHFRKSQSLGFK